ncbi:MAG: YceI family protein [Bacteroidota bacterium]
MATTKWALDPTHSEIGFKVKHLMFTNVSGHFKTFTASAETEDDTFNNATIEFSADVDSVSTNNEQRDAHLKGADFFDAATFPKMSFKATKFAPNGDGEYELAGDLTMHGVTHPVKLNAEFGGIVKDPWGNVKAGFSLNGKLHRKDFGLNWNAVLETGGVMVSEEVKIHAEIQLVKQA